MESLTRFFEAYRRTALTRTALALIVANAIPLVGVLFFGWSLWTILVIYWLENGIVGFWNLPKIALARGSIVPVERLPAEAARALGSVLATGRLPLVANLGIALFFMIHYGLFWIVHGVFVFVLPDFAGSFQGERLTGQPICPDVGFCEPATSPFGEINWPSVALAGIALFLSHGASFVFNYLGRAEYLRASPPSQMGAPYGRVVVLHLTILLGAFIAAFFGAPVGVLFVLVVMKTAFDLALHLREHRQSWLTAGDVSSD